MSSQKFIHFQNNFDTWHCTEEEHKHGIILFKISVSENHNLVERMQIDSDSETGWWAADFLETKYLTENQTVRQLDANIFRKLPKKLIPAFVDVGGKNQ